MSTVANHRPDGGSRHRPPPQVVDVDRASRYLAAAAHLDESFADRVCREYLGDHRRSIPPSTGIDAGLVLQESVAASARRRLRDMTLLALAILMCVLAFLPFLGWVLWSVLWRWLFATPRPSLLPPAGPRWRPPSSAAVIVTLLVGPLAPVLFLTGAFGMFGDLAPSSSRSFEPTDESGSGSLLLTLAFALVIVAVLTADRIAEWLVVTRTFRMFVHHASPAANAWPGARWARTVGTAKEGPRIVDVSRSGVDGNVTVFSGENPHVGSGGAITSWSMAIPLVPRDDDDLELPHADPVNRVPRLVPSEVYAFVQQEFDNLRRSAGRSLAPSARIASTVTSYQVVVDARELLRHYDDPRSRTIVPDLNGKPTATLPGETVRRIADEPIEWMRCFQRTTIESWDRELAVSAFLHVGVDERMLHLEWACHVLLPITTRYSDVDFVPQHIGRLFAGLAIDVMEFPATLPRRIKRILKRQRVADRDYQLGNIETIREMAAAPAPRNHFEWSDVDRYHGILMRHTMGAIGELLADKGISTTEFVQRAVNIINNNTNVFGDNHGVVQGGSNNRMPASTATRPGTSRSTARPGAGGPRSTGRPAPGGPR